LQCKGTTAAIPMVTAVMEAVAMRG
jgi:hypothetical protein